LAFASCLVWQLLTGAYCGVGAYGLFGAYDSYPRTAFPKTGVLFSMCNSTNKIPTEQYSSKPKRGAFDSAKNYKRQRRKRQFVAAKQEKS